MDEELIAFLNEKTSFLEKKRIEALRKTRIENIIKRILTTITIVVFLINSIIVILTPLLIILAIILIILKVKKKPKDIFEETLKEDVLPTIFKKYDHNFSYSPTGYNKDILSKSEFLHKDLFSNVAYIKGEDRVTGVIENVNVEFFEIEVVKKKREVEADGCLAISFLLLIRLFRGKRNKTKGSLDSERDPNNFYGFFMYADFHKEFNGKVVMFPKKNVSLKEKIFKIIDPSSLVRINVESPYINDNYNIYASDDQLGYYVLSQNLIDKIQMLSEKEKELPMISFVHGKMYFLIPGLITCLK